MGPIVKECEKDYADKSVEFVTFDFTSQETTAAAEAKAKELGVEQIYADKAPKTGFVLLYDTAAQKTVGTLSAQQSTEQWQVAIDDVLGS